MQEISISQKEFLREESKYLAGAGWDTVHKTTRDKVWRDKAFEDLPNRCFG